MRELEPRIPKLLLKIDPQPPGLSITLNGIDVTGLVGVESPYDLGTYTVVANAPNFQKWTPKVKVADEGKTVAVAFALRHVQNNDVEAPPDHPVAKPVPLPVVVTPTQPTPAPAPLPPTPMPAPA